MAKRKASKSPELIRLNIACGQNKEAGWIGIDIAKTAQTDIVHDLMRFPWPIKSESVSDAFCSHYVEHIPHRAYGDPGTDPWFLFWDEVYRILVPEGKCTVLAPYYSSIRCWQDPTHTRAINEFSFLYLNKAWREANKLDHYGVSCDWDFTYAYIPNATVAQHLALLNDERRTERIAHELNIVNDISITLTKRPGAAIAKTTPPKRR